MTTISTLYTTLTPSISEGATPSLQRKYFTPIVATTLLITITSCAIFAITMLALYFKEDKLSRTIDRLIQEKEEQERDYDVLIRYLPIYTFAFRSSIALQKRFNEIQTSALPYDEKLAKVVEEGKGHIESVKIFF